MIASCCSGIFGLATFFYRQNTQPSIDWAVHLVPFNASYVRRLAGWDVTRRTALLQRAVSLNPLDAQGWLQLGFDAEFRRHDPALAEKAYLQAAAVDHMYLPRSTLANFYFRQENEPAFLKWSKAALAITPFPADPIFSQMWLLDPNPVKLGDNIPERPGVLLQYASFLMNAHQFTAVPPVLKRMMDAAGNASPEAYGRTNVVGPIMDQLLWAGYPEAALQIWGFLHSASWVSLPVPSGTRPLTNGSFHSAIWNHGFDWTVLGNEGIFFNQYPEAGELRFDFSGNEPEKCTLLQQWIPTLPGQVYRLQWTASATGASKPLGLSWRIHRPGGALDSPDLITIAPGVWNFKAPELTQSTLLSLEYARPLGETRANGVFILQSVSIRPS